MLSLNQIKKFLVGFFDSHSIIKQTVYADDFDFNAERNLSYPVANIEYIDSNIAGKMVNHSFKIVLGDKTDGNVIGIDDEMISDLHLVAEDLFTWLQNEKAFLFSKSTNIQKFLDDTHDRVSGITFRIVLSVVRSQNECSIPSEYPYSSGYEPSSGSGYVINVSGTSGTSGSTGASGTSGTSGIGGTAGSGTSGTSGINGSSGTSGTSGSTGADGINGSIGSDGTSGTSGTDAIDGTSGTSGIGNINSGTESRLAYYATTGTAISETPTISYDIINNKLDVSSIAISETTSSSTGILFKGVIPFIHNYSFAGSLGANIFIGKGTGNFTLGSIANASYGSNLTVIGDGALASNTTGYQNTVIGCRAMANNTSGANSVAIGYEAMYSTVNSSAGIVAVGWRSLYNMSIAGNNTAVGAESLFAATSGGTNVAIGYRAMFANVIGSTNTVVGASSFLDFTGTSGLNNNIIIGYNTGRGIVTGVRNTIIGTSVTGLDAALSNNIIIADGAGVKRIWIDNLGNVLLGGADIHLTFGSVAGSAGYGIRDNSGTMEYRHTSGVWTSLSAAGTSGTSGLVLDDYKEITLAASPFTAQTWTNMPVARTELFGLTTGRIKINLSNQQQFRLVVSQSAAGFAGATLRVEYSTDNITYQQLEDTTTVGDLDAGATLGTKDGSWANIIAAAKSDVWIRITGIAGNATADPAWRLIQLQLKGYGTAGTSGTSGINGTSGTSGTNGIVTSLTTACAAKTGTYTLTASDCTIESSGSLTLTLPTAVGCAGRFYTAAASGGAITLNTTSSQTFANVASHGTTLAVDLNSSIIVQSNGANWIVISKSSYAGL